MTTNKIIEKTDFPKFIEGLIAKKHVVGVQEKENGKFIRIVEVPKRLEEFFARSMGQEFPEEDDRFNGCAQPLKAVLQAVWKQTKQTAITQ